MSEDQGVRPSTLDRLRSKRGATRTVYVPIEPVFGEAVDEARGELERARLLGQDTIDAEERLEKARAELRQNALTFTFKNIGRTSYQALIEAHPATGERKSRFKERFGQNPPWDTDTFPPALIAASLIEPKLSLDEVRVEIYDSDNWSDGEVAALFEAALEVNTQSSVDKWSRKSG